MRDVSNKPNTLRVATASAALQCRPETIRAIRAGELPKADPLVVARVAGIQAAKNVSLLIPYCHQVPLDFVSVEIELRDKAIEIRSEAKAVWKTGVEMEALAAVSAAALTLYDMLKPIDDSMEITSVRILEKKGGKTDFKHIDLTPLKAAVVVVSDKGARGETKDVSGKLMEEKLLALGIPEVLYQLIPDDADAIESALRALCDDLQVDILLTTGGTGVGPRDVTPDVTSTLIERELPGVSEQLRAYGQERTRYSMLSRGVAGVRGRTVIVNLPGSPGGVKDAVDILFPWLLHAVPMIRGGGH